MGLVDRVHALGATDRAPGLIAVGLVERVLVLVAYDDAPGLIAVGLEITSGDCRR